MSNKLLNAYLSKYFYCALMSFYSQPSDSECMGFLVLFFPPHHFSNSPHFSSILTLNYPGEPQVKGSAPTSDINCKSQASCTSHCAAENWSSHDSLLRFNGLLELRLIAELRNTSLPVCHKR